MLTWLRRRRNQRAVEQGLKLAKKLEAEGEIPPLEKVTEKTKQDLANELLLVKELKPAWYTEHQGEHSHPSTGRLHEALPPLPKKLPPATIPRQPKITAKTPTRTTSIRKQKLTITPPQRKPMGLGKTTRLAPAPIAASPRKSSKNARSDSIPSSSSPKTLKQKREEPTHKRPMTRELPADIKTMRREPVEDADRHEIIAADIERQREPLLDIAIPARKDRDGCGECKVDTIKTGVPGLDELLPDGIPVGSNILIAGGTGSGKTVLTLQMMAYHAARGRKCLYITMEETEKRLMRHMELFGWNPHKLLQSGNLVIKRYNPFDISRNVEALLLKAKGELLVEIAPLDLPQDFKPSIIFIDSLTALASAFTSREDSYRIYIEQLFRFLESLGCTSFLVVETEQVPKIFSPTGVEEFLSDGVIVLYHIKQGNIRENAVEVLKLRGAQHLKKIVAMQISNEGITVHPDQEVFAQFGEDVTR